MICMETRSSGLAVSGRPALFFSEAAIYKGKNREDHVQQVTTKTLLHS